jgi:signal transduction histidine kinase
MSVSVGQGRRRRQIRDAARETPLAKAFLWSVSLATLGVAAPEIVQLVRDSNELVPLTVWALIVAVVDLAPIRVWGSVSVSMSFPVALAAGMVFPAGQAGLIAFVGSFDPRELRGEVSLAKSVFNRSQVAASVMAGSAVFHALGGDVVVWPEVLLPGLGATLVDAIMNFVFVAFAVAIEDRMAPRGVLSRMFGASPWHYLAGYLLLGLLALPLAAAFAVGGVWALLLFIAPLVLAREMFRQTQHVLEAAERIREKDVALKGTVRDVVRERKDERLALAGELHDEVLPSLFKVHLLGQVLKQDLAAGRLLELDEDLPELLTATDAAQRAVRDLLGDLRRSPLGAGGLLPTIGVLVDQLRSAGGPPVVVEAGSLECTPLAQLLAYQLVRECLHNAAKYANASTLTVRLWQDDEVLRVSVADDGSGFAWSLVDTDRHFGLQIMKERIEAAGGSMFVDSRLGAGTTVAATLPRNA